MMLTLFGVVVVRLPDLARIDNTIDLTLCQSKLIPNGLRRVAHEIEGSDRIRLVLGRRSRSFVSILRDRVGPLAVLFRVPKVRLLAIKGGSSWTASHVLQKELKRSPAIADGNPDGSVVLEGAVLGVGASLNHRVPRCVSRRSSHAMKVHPGSGGFLLQTPAGSNQAGAQGINGDRRLTPALACAAPDVNPPSFFPRWGDGGESVELCSSYINHLSIVHDGQTLVRNIL